MLLDMSIILFKEIWLWCQFSCSRTCNIVPFLIVVWVLRPLPYIILDYESPLGALVLLKSEPPQFKAQKWVKLPYLVRSKESENISKLVVAMHHYFCIHKYISSVLVSFIFGKPLKWNEIYKIIGLIGF